MKTITDQVMITVLTILFQWRVIRFESRYPSFEEIVAADNEISKGLRGRGR